MPHAPSPAAHLATNKVIERIAHNVPTISPWKASLAERSSEKSWSLDEGFTKDATT
jgi:hypothetical protein